jgi:hypothetical protein
VGLTSRPPAGRSRNFFDLRFFRVGQNNRPEPFCLRATESGVVAGLRALLVPLLFAVAGCVQPAEPATGGDEAAAPLPGNDLPDGQAGDPGANSAGAGGPGSAPPPAGSGPTGAPPPGGSTASGSQTAAPGGSTSGAASGASGSGVKYSVPRSVHEAAWLCQTAVAVNDLTAAGTDGLQCRVTLTFSSTAVTVASTGIPNHDYESGSGCCTKTQSLTNTFPLMPELATSVTYPSQRGAIATAVNGVAIFGPEDSNGEDVVIVTYSSPTAQPRLEVCDAHSEPNSGTYHYHADGNCLHYHGSMADYDFSKVDSTVHSKIIGFAPDGFPIYGTYGYAADNATIQEMTSSYRLKAGADGSNGQDDQEYVAGLGDLDECNGKVGPTPEFPDGIYHYHSTKHNGEGGWGFPYFPLCYKGVVASSGGMTGGGMGGTTGGSTGSGTMSGSQTGMPPPPPGGGGPGGGMPPPPPP